MNVLQFGQEYVRHLNLEYRSSRLLFFSILLLVWEDILRLIQENIVDSRSDLEERYFRIITTSAVLKQPVATLFRILLYHICRWVVSQCGGLSIQKRAISQARS